MKKIILGVLGACCVLLASCASTNFNRLSAFPVIESGDLNSSRYIVLGEITASNSISMTNDEFSRLIKNEFAYEPQNIEVKFGNDTGDYGFIGKPVNIKMNVFERSAALAEYKLIELAKYNEADAILCFNSDTKVESNFRNTTVTTNVSGYAVKVKPDSGYTIKIPEPVVPEAPAVEEDSADDSEATEVSDVTEE